jgi:hypothetical protein
MITTAQVWPWRAAVSNDPDGRRAEVSTDRESSHGLSMDNDHHQVMRSAIDRTVNRDLTSTISKDEYRPARGKIIKG